MAIGEKPAKSPCRMRVTRSCSTEVTTPITAMITVKPASDRISISLRPKRSASRPNTGASSPEMNGVTAASRPDQSAIRAGSVTPSSRTYSGRKGLKNWKPTKAMNTQSVSAQTLRCQPSADRRGLIPESLNIPGPYTKGAAGPGGPIVSDMRAGQAVIELLKIEQVRHVFGIVGSTFLDVLDVLYDDKSVEYINVRHEQGAAFMADGLARVSGLPAACLVTAGPGATNLITGIAAAYVAHSPVVAIAGGPPSGHYHKDAFQELDLVGMLAPVTKLSIRIDSPQRIPEIFRLALRAAMTGRKGPVFIDIPRDVLNDQTVRAELGEPGSYRPLHAPPPSPEAISDAVGVLRAASRPLMLVGGGVTWADANDLVRQLSADFGLPTITAYGRNDAVANDDPLYVGPLGRAGSPEAAAACRRADVLLVVGSRLGNFTTFYDDRYIQPATRIIQIDIDSRDLGRTYPVAVAMQADAGGTLAALRAALGRAGMARTSDEWRHEIGDLRTKRHAQIGRASC